MTQKMDRAMTEMLRVLPGVVDGSRAWAEDQRLRHDCELRSGNADNRLLFF